MGRGDKRTRKGKIFRNSYDNTRPQKAAAKSDKAPTAKTAGKAR